MANEEKLYSDTLQVERKFFFFDLKRNSEGTFLKITEKKDDRRNSIIIPDSGLAEFVDKIKDVLAKGLV
jgi:hypothetical protein